jgi:hypothetical protein
MTGSVAPSHPEAAAAGHKAAMPAEKRDSPILSSVSREERHALICNAAYYLAERRGFANGDAAQDWLMAEKEVDQLLGIAPASGSHPRQNVE